MVKSCFLYYLQVCDAQHSDKPAEVVLEHKQLRSFLAAEVAMTDLPPTGFWQPHQIGGAARSVINCRAVTLSRWIMYNPAAIIMAMPIRLSALGKSLKTR